MRKAIWILVVFMLVSIGCTAKGGGETVAPDASVERTAEPQKEKREEKQSDAGAPEGTATKEGGVVLPGGGTKD